MNVLLLLRILPYLAAALIAGCSTKSMNELIGMYSVTYPHGTETLRLEKDNVFTQLYTSSTTSLSITNSGTWEFLGKDNAILLRDVIEFEQWDEEDSLDPERIVWRIRIARRFGKISLIIREDEVLEYKRVQ